jgi:hypothetical protein
VPKGGILPETGQQAMEIEERPWKQGGPYALRSATLDTVDQDLMADWEAFRSSTPSPMRDPGWLKGYFEGQTGNLQVHGLYQAGSLCGIAPFLKRDWPLAWHLGELPVASFPLTRLRLLGGSLAFPEDADACDLLFRRLLSDGDFDTLFFDEIPVNSFFWNYLHTSKLVDDSFLAYEPDPPSPHPILRIQGTFEEYMGKFSPKHRKNLQRSIKKLRDGALGEMRLVRYESSDEVETFLQQAVEISRKTYQWQLHQRGLSAVDLIRPRLEFASRHGWMRCYLLFCGGRACAFVVGYQYEGMFVMDEIGHDPELSKHSVGTVLQLLTVEDLFDYKRADIFDLQGYAWYKGELSNESYLQGAIFLFRRGTYPRFLRAGHRMCSVITKGVSSTLDRWGLKSKVRKAVRSLGGSH